MAFLCSFPISDLPLELLPEILYKLPVKQLHRNKIICKLWSSLISHPSFRSKYLLRTKSSSFTLYLTFPIQPNWSWYDAVNGEFTMVDGELDQSSISILTNSQDRISSLTFLPKIPETFFYVLGSSNGLLLCINRLFPKSIYYVCNPVTKQWITLPPPPSPDKVVLSGLVCYPSSCELSADTLCKVVNIRALHDSGVMDAEIFESATNQWRKLTTTLDGGLIKFDIKTVNPVELSGILYWLSEISHSVLAFDTNLDRCIQISLPEKEGFGSVFGASSGDHLYYVQIDYLYTLIWILDEKSSNWRIHGKFNFDWIDQEINLLNSCLLAIDPADCNVLYLTTNSTKDPIKNICPVYSLDLVRKQTRRLFHFPETLGNPLRSFTYIHPVWPTLVPSSIDQLIDEV